MATTNTKQYIETVGRRKTSSARLRLQKSSKNEFNVNDKSLNDYFKTAELQRVAMEPLTTLKSSEKYTITVRIKGGGISSQAEAVRHALSRALVKEEGENRKILKKAGFLKRDPRTKERRKFGLKKARKAPQWSKR